MTTRYSNSKFLTILDPIGLEQVGWECQVISPLDWSTVLAYVPRYTEVMIHKVANDFGMGSLVLDADDPVLHDPLPLSLDGTILDRECLYRVYKNGVLKHEWLGEDTEEDVATEDESRITKISGRTTEKVLEWGVAAPGQIEVEVPDPKAEQPADWNAELIVTLKSLTSNVATLQFTGTHSLVVGDTILVDEVDATFNGVYQITAVTSNTVSYDRTAANVGATAGTGTITQHYEQDWEAPLITEMVLDPMSFQQMPAITAFRWLMLENIQGRGTLPFVTLMFDNDEDSAGEPWADVSDVVISPGETPLALLQRLSAALGWEFKMLPGFRLFIAQTGFGQHREGAVKFFISGQQQTHGRTGTTREIATNVFAKSQDGSVAQASGSSDASPWQREAWLEAGDAETIDGANRVANSSVELLRNRKVGRTIKIVDDAPGRTLFEDYDVQDWISVEDERYDTYEVKVMGATLTVDADAQVDLELTIQTKFEARAVQVQRTLDKLGASAGGSSSASIVSATSAGSTVRIGDLIDVSVLGSAPGDLLVYDGSRWIVRSPSQILPDLNLALDDLTDVDTSTVPPSSGQALVWSSVQNKWVPGTVSGGGVGVGEWVNDKTVTFTSPAWVEHDIQGSPVNVTNVKPVSAQFTITDPPLVTSSDDADVDPLGYMKCLYFVFSVSHQAATGLNATLSAELMRNGIVIATTADAGHTNTERGTVAFYVREAAPGDVYEVRIWFSAGTYAAGSKVDWWAYRSFPSRIGRATPPGAGGRYVFRDVSVLGSSGVWVPTTTLAFLPTFAAGTNGFRLFDQGTYLATSISNDRLYSPDSTWGLIVSRGYDYDPAAGGSGAGVVYVADATSTRIETGDTPMQVKFDRLAIPNFPV